MDEAEQISALVGDIYDAALEPAGWPAVLSQLTHFIGGAAATIFWKDAAIKTGSASYGVGIEQH